MVKRKKITINKKAKHWKDKHPFVEVEWVDICSNADWMSFDDLMSMTLPICYTKGHLLTQKNGVTRVFADASIDDKGELETIGNVTIIPNSVIKNIKKL